MEFKSEHEEASGQVKRSLEGMHRDVDFANRYRLELIKHTMSLSTAVFVFTIAFLKDIVGSGDVHLLTFLGIGWILMIASLVGGLGHMYCWDRYYISYRDYDWHRKQTEGKMARKRINHWRIFFMTLQFSTFGFGLLAITVFSLSNF